MSLKHAAIFLFSAVTALSGCANDQYYFRSFNADATSVSADAKQRMVYSVTRTVNNQPRHILCAEPSPDAISALATSLSGKADLTLPSIAGGTPTPTELSTLIKAEAQRQTAEAVAYIGARNGTIQLLRDGLYRSCEAYMNGAIGDFGYGLILSNYGRLMVALLSAEGITKPSFSEAGSVITPGRLGQPQSGANGQASTDSLSDHLMIGSDGAGAASSSVPDAARIFKEVVLPLAQPHGDDADKTTMVDLTVACMMMSEVSGARSGVHGEIGPVRAACNEIVRNVPVLAMALTYATFDSPDSKQFFRDLIRQRPTAAVSNPGTGPRPLTN